MAEEQGKVAELRKWFIENKLKAVGGLWAASVIGSFAYNFSNPNMKTSVKVIHARLHAQALTLAALAGSAAVEYGSPWLASTLTVVCGYGRLHAQALTLAALAGSAAVEYYDHQSGEKAKRYEKHVQ